MIAYTSDEIFASVVITKGAGKLGNISKSKYIKFKGKKARGVGNPVETLNRGSSGRTQANFLEEQMVMHEIQSNPLKNAKELPIKMIDNRWPSNEVG